MSMVAPITDLPLFATPEPAPRRFGEADPPAWTEDQLAVHAELRRHEGADRAIRADDLATAVGMDSTRRLQRIIHQLIYVHGIAVGSSMREPYGYYLAVTCTERREVGESLIRRGFAIVETGRRVGDIDEAEVVARLQTEMGGA